MPEFIAQTFTAYQKKEKEEFTIQTYINTKCQKKKKRKENECFINAIMLSACMCMNVMGLKMREKRQS